MFTSALRCVALRVRLHLVCLVLAAGCEDTHADGLTGAGAAAKDVACDFYYRVTNVSFSPVEEELPFEEQTLLVGPGESKSLDLGDLTLSMSYIEEEYHGTSVTLSVAAGDTSLFHTLYQKVPENQFGDNHGFTGLVYLTHPTEGGDYQLICRSVLH